MSSDLRVIEVIERCLGAISEASVHEIAVILQVGRVDLTSMCLIISFRMTWISSLLSKSSKTELLALEWRIKSSSDAFPGTFFCYPRTREMTGIRTSFETG